MSPLTIDRIWQDSLDMLTMVLASALIVVLAGIPLALIPMLTASDNALESLRVRRALGALTNGSRTTPLTILLVALLPFTRPVVSTTIGVWAAIVSLSISATPFFVCIAEISLCKVDRGLMEAAQAMGCERHHIVWYVLLPETLPGIIDGSTLTVVSLIGASTMADAADVGGLGGTVIRCGYQRFDTTAMAMVIVVLIGLVSLMQRVGDTSVWRLKAR